MANAFGSTKREVISEKVPAMFVESDVKFGEQRHRWTAAELPTSDAPLLLRNADGSYVGDQFAVKAFLHCYEEPTNYWNAQYAFYMAPKDASFFVTSSPVDDATVTDLSFLHKVRR